MKKIIIIMVLIGTIVNCIHTIQTNIIGDKPTISYDYDTHIVSIIIDNEVVEKYESESVNIYDEKVEFLYYDNDGYLTIDIYNYKNWNVEFKN